MERPETYMFDTSMPERLSEYQMQVKLEAFNRGLVRLEKRPPGHSVELIAFAQTAQSLLGEGSEDLPEFREVAMRFLADRPKLSPSIAVQLFWRTFQHELMNTTSYNHPDIVKRQELYPDGHRSHQAWMKTFTVLLKNTSCRNEIEECLAIKNNQSTQPDRYLGAYLAILLHQDLLGDNPTIVEAGCASRIGLNKLESNSPFTNYSIEAEPRIKKRLKGLLAADYALGKMVGFDRAEIDLGARLWIEHNSVYPSEINMAAKRRERALLYTKSDNVPLQADLTVRDWRLEAVHDKFDATRADVGIGLTTFYEIPADLQSIADENFNRMIAKLKYIQDAARIDPEDDTKLIYSDFDDQAVGYNGFVQYREGSDRRYRHILSFRDGGRARVLVPGRDLEEVLEAA